MLKIIGSLILAVGNLLGINDPELQRLEPIEHQILLPELPAPTEGQKTDVPPENIQKTAEISPENAQPEIGGEELEKAPEIAEIKAKPASQCTSCVTWARQNSPIQPPRVKYAKEIPILYEKPRVGSWIVFGGRGIWGTAGHTGIVRFVNPENPNLVTFEGCNYPAGQKRLMTINTGEGKYDLLGYFDSRHD